jgi:tRNA threonylcarbamoyl adenosine modification protein YjeE
MTAFAERLATFLQKRRPQNVFLQLEGQLGSGKTTFAKAFISRWLDLDGSPIAPHAINSPSYVIAQEYGASGTLVHLDLFRLDHDEDLSQMGLEVYFYDYRCCVVEWLERSVQALALAPRERVVVRFEIPKDSPQSPQQLTRRLLIEGLPESF